MRTWATHETGRMLSTVQVAKAAKATYRQIDHWNRTGALGPYCVPARGSGGWLLWSPNAVKAVRLANHLFSACRTGKGGRFLQGTLVARAIQAAHDAGWPEEGYVLVSASDVQVVRDVEDVSRNLRGAAWLVAPLGEAS